KLAMSAPISPTVTAEPNYTHSASTGSLGIMQGASGTSTVTITPQNGFGGSVSLSASGLPGGVTASFSPNPATATSTLTLAASGTATMGTVAVTITGTSGSLTNTTTIALTVNLPPGWSDADVGSVGTAGSASYVNGTFTVKASGKWIYDVADGMHFVYQASSGDKTIVARVVSVQGSALPEAGVMIRETLGPSSIRAYTTWGPYPRPALYFYSR